MKQILAILALTASTLLAQSQSSELDLTPAGMAPVVIPVDSMTAAQIYTKAKAWVLSTYKNPDKVLKEDVANERLRIDGYKKDAWYIKTLGTKTYMNMEYSLAIDIKDGKVRATFTPGEFTSNSGKSNIKTTDFYKDGEVRNMYKDSEISLEDSANELLWSLVTAIKAKKEDW